MILTKKKLSNIEIVKRLIISVSIALVPMVGLSYVHASPITGRSVVLSSSVADASGVSYALTTAALPTTGTAIKSVEIKFCTSLTGGCVTPTNFSSSASTLASQPTGLGSASGWTVNTATAGSLRIVQRSHRHTSPQHAPPSLPPRPGHG